MTQNPKLFRSTQPKLVIPQSRRPRQFKATTFIFTVRGSSAEIQKSDWPLSENLYSFVVGLAKSATSGNRVQIKAARKDTRVTGSEEGGHAWWVSEGVVGRSEPIRSESYGNYESTLTYFEPVIEKMGLIVDNEFGFH